MIEVSAQKFQNQLREKYEGKNSLLKEDEIAKFKGLDFFPINDKYKIYGELEKLNSNEILTLKTSKNLSKKYKKYGKISFFLEGSIHHLFVYQPYPVKKEYQDYLFLPFRDETTGTTSYGSGRYMDISINDSKKSKIILDFNKSYNPYCAYSKYYNCPITPYENTLDIPIEAGIKYDYSDYLNND